MLVEETQTIKVHPENKNHTQIEAKARIISNMGWSYLKSKIEQYGITKGTFNMHRSAKGLSHVLDTITSKV